jgi:hypothetical protein
MIMRYRQDCFAFASPAAAPDLEIKPQLDGRYHRESFALLGRELPPVARLIVDLPASVAQWYALADSLSLLAEYSNADSPVPPEEFEYHIADKKHLATFLYENQGVCWWAFDLKGGDDPAVYIDIDPPRNRWSRCCSSFSKFVYSRLFDFRHWCHPTLSAGEIGPPLEAHTLRDLRKSCRQHPSTRGWPGDTQYRFSEDDRRFTLCKGKGQTDWYLSATTNASLELAVAKYRQLIS